MSYARTITDDLDFVSGEIFAKILTTNDNNSKHGVLIPPASYGFFPELPILDPKRNARKVFSATNTTSKQASDLSWLYYQKYPERRITRASPLLNDQAHGRRLIIMTKIRCSSGKDVYYVDVVIENLDPRFTSLIGILFAGSSLTSPGAYVLLPLDASQFVVDENLGELLKLFDNVKALGWVDSLRMGDTGIGYTFESLVGIQENNSPEADFRGIEIKCKLQNGTQSPSGKINLFQCGPQWLISGPMLSRIHVIGAPNDEGVMSCYSQVTTTGNNKGLWLGPSTTSPSLSLFKNNQIIGKWNHKRLSDRFILRTPPYRSFRFSCRGPSHHLRIHHASQRKREGS